MTHDSEMTRSWLRMTEYDKEWLEYDKVWLDSIFKLRSKILYKPPLSPSVDRHISHPNHHHPLSLSSDHSWSLSIAVAHYQCSSLCSNPSSTSQSKAYTLWYLRPWHSITRSPALWLNLVTNWCLKRYKPSPVYLLLCQQSLSEASLILSLYLWSKSRSTSILSQSLSPYRRDLILSLVSTWYISVRPLNLCWVLTSA
jgi:hypothetical protein